MWTSGRTMTRPARTDLELRRRPAEHAAGADERLVGAGDLHPAGRVGEQQRDDDDRDDDRDHPAIEAEQPVEHLALLARVVGAAAAARSSCTISPVPAVPTTRTVRPAGMSASAVAANSWVMPSFLARTVP